MILTADTVVTGSELLRPGWIEIKDGRVMQTGAGASPQAVDVALGAVTVVPGFVDMHTHGGGGGAFPEATAEASEAAVALHRRHGSTSMVASLVAAHPDELLREVEVLAGQVEDDLLAGIHLEGPWMSPHRLGAHELSALRTPDPAEIARVLDAGRGTIRMVTLAPELDGMMEAIPQFVAGGVVAAVGHTDATYEQTIAAIDAGARVATHLFNAMRPVHHREPGPVVALMEDPRVTVELITDGTHLHPALYRNVMGRVGADRIALVTDAMAAAGMADGAYRLGALDVDVVDGVAKVAGTDTIAGSTATVDHVFRFAVEHSGLERDDALLAGVQQSSINPARAVGLVGERPGAIGQACGFEVGAPGDLVVLDDDLHVVRVMRRGEWI